MDDNVRKRAERQMAGAKRRAANWKGTRHPHEGYTATEDCPVPATHDKLDEVHYFLHRMLGEIHHPDEFRWMLNAFLQASRSVLYLAKSELKKREGFDDWWKAANERLHTSPVMKRVIDSRNLIVHEKMLTQTNTTYTGVFRGRQVKMGFGGPVPNEWYSENLLHYIVHVWTGVYINKKHTWIGEQFGVKREWHVAELGEGDVSRLCAEAHDLLTEFVVSAHDFGGTGMDPETREPVSAHDPDNYNVLLETDLNPSLVEKWWGG